MQIQQNNNKNLNTKSPIRNTYSMNTGNSNIVSAAPNGGNSINNNFLNSSQNPQNMMGGNSFSNNNNNTNKAAPSNMGLINNNYNSSSNSNNINSSQKNNLISNSSMVGNNNYYNNNSNTQNVISMNIQQMKNWNAKNEDDLQLIKEKHENLIGLILAEQEQVISAHRGHIDEMVELVKQEMFHLHQVDKPGSDVEQYVGSIDTILAH